LICKECEPHGGFDKGFHVKEHTLLTVYDTNVDRGHPTNEENTIHQLIAALESKVNDKLELLTARMDSLDERIERKFGRLETLLEQLLGSNMTVADHRGHLANGSSH
jgi:hypothetical protein